MFITLPARTLRPLSFGLLLCISVLCLLFPRMDGDAAVYALLAKHMVLQGDAFNLVFQGKDWLDKPHFPFWMMAISFELFGVNEYAYQVPGLLFFAAGAWFTRKLALFLSDEATASLTTLIYLTLFGLLLAVHDQKAEVYLLALMAAASYAWLNYERQTSFKYGLLGAVSTAAAVMTKGIFVLGILGVGLLAMLVYCRAWVRLFHWKWLLAMAGTLLFTTPELVALYLQFDAHPEKLVFGQAHVSGLKFFLWDSQFGRFLNTGPIQNDKGSPFFFLHNLIWTFFPTVLVLVAALYADVRRGFVWQAATAAGAAGGASVSAPVFLWSTFLSALALFSATRYQMDYYLVIVFPYAAIACGYWLSRLGWALVASHWLLRLHLGYVTVMLVLSVLCALLYFWHGRDPWVLLTLLPLLGLAVMWKKLQQPARVLAWSLCAVLMLFAFTVTFHRDLYVKFNIGHVVARYLNTQPRQPVYVYDMIFNTFDFFSQSPSLPVRSAQELLNTNARCCGAGTPGRAFYVVARTSQAPDLVQNLTTELQIRSGGDAGSSLQVRTLQQFEEIELPKQFVWQLLKDDQTLPRQSLSVLQVMITP